MISMSFIGLQAFKVKLFLKTHCGALFWITCKKSNSQEPPFLHFFYLFVFSIYNPKVLANLISLVLGLQMIKNPLMQPAAILFCIFAHPLWISLFLNFFFILKSFLSSNNTPGRVSSGQIPSLLDMYFK